MLIVLVVVGRDERFARSVTERHGARLNSCCRNMQGTRAQNKEPQPSGTTQVCIKARAGLVKCKLDLAAERETTCGEGRGL